MTIQRGATLENNRDLLLTRQTTHALSKKRPSARSNTTRHCAGALKDMAHWVEWDCGRKTKSETEATPWSHHFQQHYRSMWFSFHETHSLDTWFATDLCLNFFFFYVKLRMKPCEKRQNSSVNSLKFIHRHFSPISVHLHHADLCSRDTLSEWFGFKPDNFLCFCDSTLNILGSETQSLKPFERLQASRSQRRSHMLFPHPCSYLHLHR